MWISINSILEKLVSNEATALFCGLIFLIAYYSYFRFKYRLNYVLNELNTVREFIAQTPESKLEFCEAWDRGQVEFEKLNQLRTPWNLYKAQIRHLDDYSLSPTPVLCSQKDSREFFHEESLLSYFLNLRFYNAMPSILTGLGIFFTFVGLAAGVSLAYGNIGLDGQMQDIEAITQSMQHLLGGAGQAFWSSICGLSLSLLFQWRKKVQLFNAIQQIEFFNEELDKRIEVVTPELLALHTHQQLVKQSTTINEVAQSWRLEMEGLLNALFEKQQTSNQQMITVLENVGQGITNMSRNQADQVSEFLGHAMVDFGDALKQQIGNMTESFSKSAEGVSRSVEALDLVLERMSQSVDAMSTTVNEGLTQISQTVTTIREDFDSGRAGVTEMVTELKTNVEGMSSALTSASAEFKRDIGEAFDNLDSSVEGFKSILTGQEAILATYKDTTAELNGVVGTLTSSLENLESVQTSVGEGVKQLIEGQNRVEKQLREATEEINEQMQATIDEADNVSQDLHTYAEEINKIISDNLKKLAEGFNDLHEQIQKNLSTADTHIGKALSSLSTTMESWDKAQGKHNEKLSGNISAVNQSIRELKELLAAYEKSQASINAKLAETASRLEQSV